MRGKQFDGFPTREAAMKDFFAAWAPVDGEELVPLDEAAGRITARPIHSVNTLPVYRVSACDGIAVRAADFADGVPNFRGWQEGREYFRADTGDDFPDEFDAVIMIEEVDFDAEEHITFISPDVGVKVGDNVRDRGSTLRAGDLLMEANLPIRPTDMASLAMGGVSMVPVRKKPIVAFIPTGSELVAQGTIPKRGENVDSNSILVKHTLMELGAQPLMFPIVPDKPELLDACLREALDAADIVIMNAGTSRGSEDFNFGLTGRKGKLIHHYIAAAPGRPMGLAVIDGKPVINLPGPAMATYFGLEWCISAIVARWLHIPARQRPRVSGELMDDILCNDGMAILNKMDAVRRADGSLEIHARPFKGSSMANSLGSNAQYVSDVGELGRRKGENIEVELLRTEEFLKQGF